MRSSRVWMRSIRVVRASGNSKVAGSIPASRRPTQWKFEGRQMKQCAHFNTFPFLSRRQIGKITSRELKIRVRICKRLWRPGIDSASLCCLSSYKGLQMLRALFSWGGGGGANRLLVSGCAASRRSTLQTCHTVTKRRVFTIHTVSKFRKVECTSLNIQKHSTAQRYR
jgi:hypothetical protein